MSKTVFVTLFALAFMFLFAFLFAGIDYIAIQNRETVEAKIVQAERHCGGVRSCLYLVYTDREVFANKDQILVGKFNSSDVQNQVLQAKDQTCELDVYGWRIPFFSVYRNIVKVNCSNV